MNDSRAQAQLSSGFYSVEAGAWRWTAGKFSVVLRPPAGASTKGATLKLALNIPESVIHAVNGVTLSAKVGDTALPPESYSRNGDYTYSRDVPSSALQGDNVRIDFSLDKFIPPTGADHRELGLIAKQVSLISK